MVNKSSEALEFMQGSFPQLMSSITMDYTGPGEDCFLDFCARCAEQCGTW